MRQEAVAVEEDTWTRALRDSETEHAQLAVDARRTPGRVLQCHPMYQGAQAGLDWRSPWTAAPREPGPIATKTGLVPADHRLGFHEDKHVGPSQPQPPQGEPEKSVGGNDAGTLTVAGKHGQLLPEREVFEHKVSLGEEDGAKRTDRQEEATDHEGSNVLRHRSKRQSFSLGGILARHRPSGPSDDA